MPTASPAAAQPQASTATGIACILAAVLLFSVYNALTKWVVADYSVWQIMFFRGLAGVVPFFIWAWLMAPDALRSQRPSLQALRAAFGLAANVLFILAYREMPLAEAVAIGYAAPIFIVVLSVPLLSERVGIQRASAAVVGFIGVVMIAQPGAGLFSSGALYAMSGTLFYALLISTTRRVGASDPALCTVVYTSGIYTLATSLTLPAVWITPGPVDLALMISIGLVGSTAMLVFAHAYRHAAAALLAPFDYSAMLWAGLLGFVVWHEVPSPLAIAGMIVVAGAGLFLMRHERLSRFRQEKP